MAALCCQKLFYRSPIVVILGATGTGKSNLAIELAKRFKGEVINADAMQMYKGLDIATNKVTTDEQNGVPHHLLGVWDPKVSVIVSDFRNAALNIIKDILNRNKLPIIVGGTCYYIESILYKVLIDNPKKGQSLENNDTSDELMLPVKRAKLDLHSDFEAKFKDVDNEQLLQRLREVDPETADTLHPNNRRKILRSLEIFYLHNQTHSSLVKEQKSTSEGMLRFTNAIILWLYCEKEVLNCRLFERVDQMISKGLIQELEDFHDQFQNPDYTKGVFQAIGFKEFDKYLALDKEMRKTEEGKELLEKGREMLQIANRQYAKRQNKWIANRFLKKNYDQAPIIYELNGTDLSKWKENVVDVAEDIVESHLAGRKPKIEPLLVEEARQDSNKVYKCEICNKFLVGEVQYQIHLKSNRHKNVCAKAKRKKNTVEEKSLMKEAVS